MTEWRLKKHAKIHSITKIKICKYFKKSVFCPFDKFGCKFRHDEEYVEVHDDVQVKNLHVEDYFDEIDG